jgi:uncharacterized protein (DUF1800 family)
MKTKTAGAVVGSSLPVKSVDLETVAFSRMGYGPRPEDLAAFQRRPGTPREKFLAYTEEQLNPAGLADTSCDKRLEGFASLNKSSPQLWQEYYLKAPEGEKKYEIIFKPTEETRCATLIRAVYSSRQLLEVLTDFWHNHFNVTPDRDERIAPHFAAWDALIRKHALGNFRSFLEAVATHPAMLYYLDNASSSRSGPNENWARELFELHTLGAENYLGVKRQTSVAGYPNPSGYVDDDVYEATRAFTGWRVNDTVDKWQPGMQNTGSFRYYAPWHDRFQKTVLGRYLPPDQADMKDGRDVLDTLAKHPGTARFIAYKLVRRLVSDKPPEALVAEAAKVFLRHANSPDQIKQVVRSILHSEAFGVTWGQKIKRPLEVYAGMLRALDADIKKPQDLLWHLYELGQPLFGRIPPDGYPDKREAWDSTSGMLQRWRWAIGLSDNWWEESVVTNPTRQTPANVRTPKDLLEFWSKRIGVKLSTQSQAAILGLTKQLGFSGPLNAEQIKYGIPGIVGAILASPEYQLK